MTKSEKLESVLRIYSEGVLSSGIIFSPFYCSPGFTYKPLICNVNENQVEFYDGEENNIEDVKNHKAKPLYIYDRSLFSFMKRVLE